MPKKKLPNRSNYSLISMTWNIGIAIVILPLLGFGLDHQFHTAFFLTILGLILGLSYSFYEAWRVMK